MTMTTLTMRTTVGLKRHCACIRCRAANAGFDVPEGVEFAEPADLLADAFQVITARAKDRLDGMVPQFDIPNIVRTGKRLAYFDLDGVICNDQHRVHHAQARNWGDYFARMTEDTPWRQGRELFEAAILAGFDVAFLTGRREDTRQWTVDWLQQHGYDHTLPLVMRPENERMPLANLKAAVVAESLRFIAEVQLFDDDPEVVKLVGQLNGATARHCTWHVKDKSLIKKAQF